MEETKERPKTVSTARDLTHRFLRHENAVLVVVLVALLAGMAVATHGLSIRAVNMRNVLLEASIRGVASIGQAFVILTAGIDVSVAGIGLLASTVGATLMTTNQWQNIAGHPFPVIAAVPIMLAVGAAVGLANGLMVSRIGMPSLIVTLGMWRITWGLGFLCCGGESIANLPTSLEWLGNGRIGGLPTPAILFIALIAVAYFVLTYTGFGRSIYAFGGNASSAWLSGINVKKTQLSVFIISGLLAAVSAVIVTSRVGSVMTRTLQGLEMDTIASVVVGGVSLMGGRGNMIGVLIGVLIIGVIDNGMIILGADITLQGMVKGGIIAAAVAIDAYRRLRR